MTRKPKTEKQEQRDYMGEAAGYLLYMQRIDEEDAAAVRKMQAEEDIDGIIAELDVVSAYVNQLRRGLRKLKE